MERKMEISLVPAQRIDRNKWDRCISGSPNGMIYAYADYLDHMTEHWTGLVVGDYSAVMPIPWKQKYGIRYVCQVPFVQQLGIFTTGGDVPYKELLQHLLSYCRYGDYSFNWGNLAAITGVSGDGALSGPGFQKGVFSSQIRSNYVLRLDHPYTSLENTFSPDTRQNIRRSQRFGLAYRPAGIAEAIGLYRLLYMERIKVLPRDFTAFEELCGLLEKKDRVVVRKSVDATGALLSVVLLLKDERRLYNIMNGTTPEGRAREANFFLLSEVWKEYAQSGYLFDFEGSDLPGVRAFYRKFGAVAQPYPQLHFNRLPRVVRWLKR